MNEPLSQAVKMTQAILPSAGVAGLTPINGAILDMQDYESVLIVVVFGAIVAGAVTTIKAQRGDAANLSDAADIAGSGQAIADTADETVFFIDIVRPSKRYVRLVVGRGTQNATVASAFYLQYDGRIKPAAQPAGISGERFVDATEGTA